mmetsp:Transcript_6802/g.9520  ORF Transcript_6802/g.9520 Transcript_6802/m.9520 type:complete len:337 (-) Transcript_6802:1298-2308(-)
MLKMWELASARRVPLLFDDDYEEDEEKDEYFDDLFTLSDNCDLIYGELGSNAFGRLVTSFKKDVFIDVGCGRGVSIKAVQIASKNQIWCWGLDLASQRLDLELDVVLADARYCCDWLLDDAVIFLNWLAFCEQTRNTLLDMLITSNLKTSIIITVGWSLPRGPFRLIATTPLKPSWGSTCCVFSHSIVREEPEYLIIDDQHTKIPLGIADAADELLQSGIFGNNTFAFDFYSKCPRINDTLDVLRSPRHVSLLTDKKDDNTSTCTYLRSRKYGTRQSLFTCLSCCPDGCFAVCSYCARHCHSGHSLIVELHESISFCDCGFATRCCFYSPTTTTHK